MSDAPSPKELAGRTRDHRIEQAKSAIAKRLRHVRQHHPEGPFTLAALAERAGVSKRTLAQAESAQGSNLTIETLVKVASALGITRDAYFLDEQVFHEVNTELETLKELREQKVESVALRTSTPTSTLPPGSLEKLTGLLKGILDSATRAQDTLQELPPDSPGPLDENAS
ncbi:helix-turn-helix transcriptional regulator [Streptomyces sp. ME19-01-6]|uniref:helix-turn-helix domain-containing protein n=1 Tax=Streptomyces sp. ME19-01-6 TaxID=3028686 RepID=UPI0029A58C87|nr:helix-turn-helix transcriptional regulator [Streptomyces sp. ME19-01-6]MDX3224480.1 helix-turn-helix transcriptional regulator [Streptomyces sp. ME19-01-6]